MKTLLTLIQILIHLIILTASMTLYYYDGYRLMVLPAVYSILVISFQLRRIALPGGRDRS